MPYKTGKTKNLHQDGLRPRNKPLTEDESNLLDELLARVVDDVDIPDYNPSPLEERRDRLFFLYLLARNIENFDVTPEWLQYVLTGKDKP